MPDLRGKVTIITGASSGIGRGTAVEFAQLGAHLALTGRNQENLQATAKACVEAGTPQDKILLVTGDICDEQVQKNLVEQTVQKFGRIDVLVNNAGIGGPVTIETIDMATYDRIMNVNVRSVVTLTQLCIPHLAKTQGTIVNVSSGNGLRPYPGSLAYNMSKSAVDQFTRCVALELASKQIRVNSVNPGIIPTEIFKRAGRTEEECAKLLEHSKSAHALGRNGEVTEVAKTIAFLASSDASFITGAQVPVDGGRHAMCPR
ncbi:3-oxoacyl-[acyl-carrier-protein] reductase FabG-like [Branchiostoma floridae]|uniref:3-oxoacyl-[acyl-carrier-protein] reductase FabG-like n=1 Tax=Branchiostoma floridae TaxID=7739 RepID=A0A9J7HGH6_BRAFL|nr:3-oxoacyl-[acyl-carrier-protein] reductase FabG-like [Branchiostoma floridae]